MQGVERFVLLCLGPISFSDSDADYHLGLVGTFQFLLHQGCPFLQKTPDDGQYALDAGLFLQVGKGHFRLCAKRLPHFLFVWSEGCRGFPFFVQQDLALALQLETRWKRCLEDIAQAAEVVVAGPLPKSQLRGKYARLAVQHLGDGLGRIGGPLVVQPQDDGGVELPVAKRYNDAATDLQRGLVLARHGIREGTLQRQRHYDICKLWHTEYKGTK